METPAFRYHPDPVATGSAEPTDADCDVCHEPARIRYVGPVYGEQADVICLRCISNGQAAKSLAIAGIGPAIFTDVADAAGAGVSADVLAEIESRTPGFHSFQDPRWLFHCNDGCAYLGPATRAELTSGAREFLVADAGLTADDLEHLLGSLGPDGSACAYSFRCLHCGVELAYADYD